MKYNGPIASLYIGTMEVQCAQIVQIFKKIIVGVILLLKVVKF